MTPAPIRSVIIAVVGIIAGNDNRIRNGAIGDDKAAEGIGGEGEGLLLGVKGRFDGGQCAVEIAIDKEVAAEVIGIRGHVDCHGAVVLDLSARGEGPEGAAV